MHPISTRPGLGYATLSVRTAMACGLLAACAGYSVSAAEVSADKSGVGTEPIKVSANEAKAGSSDVSVLPRVDVIGSGTRSGTESSGSAAVIDGRTLEESRVFNVNEALRKVPGVHVREEEGVGLRPNIGIRGLNPTRSTKTLLLEDGLPLSFAPYGDNASYYHPPIDRYESIEVSKGSQVIRFGPQTAGGVINYITPEPQKEFGGLVGLAAGTRGYLNAHVMATGNGAILDLYRKESDGARDNMHSRLDDLNFKWAGQLNDDHKLVLRATYFKEYSQLTYSGLTQAEYTNLGARYNPFKNDFFDASRTGLSATHEVRLNADTKVLTSVYGAYFDRDWWRQASDTGSAGLNCLSATRDAGSRLGSSDLDNCAMQGRLRQYTTAGIDSRIQTRHQLFGIANDLEMGVKYHHEIQERRRQEYASYTQYLSSTGMTLGENQQRRTNATSGFISNKFQLNERLFITPIMRVEYIQHEQINRLNSTRGASSFTEVVPGIGASYQLSEHSQLYGGVHKGFSPPRVEDAINSNGASVDLSAERSVNAELGLRSKPMRDVVFDIALFRNDFSNLVAVGSIAGGSTNYSEGKALMQGIEASGQLDRLIPQIEGNLFSRLSMTYLPTAEQSSIFNRPGGAGTIAGTGAGKRLPYAPEFLLNLTLGYRAPSNWNARAEYVFVGKQYSDFANTVTPSATSNGQTGLIDAYGIWNVVANYTVGSATLFITAKNLTNQTYIVDRTRGIQVGMPRTLQAGIKYAF
ncbi:MAG: TonB-dependent receptor [Burkholderiales bacterium]|nr:TonB-dependent receptor [Burkholderiales bacterium]